MGHSCQVPAIPSTRKVTFYGVSELGHKIIIIVKDSDSCPPGPVSDGCTRYTTQRDRERQCETERGGVYESGGLQGLTHTSVYIKKRTQTHFQRAMNQWHGRFSGCSEYVGLHCRAWYMPAAGVLTVACAVLKPTRGIFRHTIVNVIVQHNR